LLAAVCLVLSSCLDNSGKGALRDDRWTWPIELTSSTQQGDVTIREGTDVEVRFPHPYEGTPKVTLVELRGAMAGETQYSMDDLHIVNPTPRSFRVRNEHTEHGESWATVRWRAEGALAKRTQTGLSGQGDALAKEDRSPQEILIERIKAAGGKVSVDPIAPNSVDAQLASRESNPNNKQTLDVNLTSSVDPRFAKNSIVSIDLHRSGLTDSDLTQLEPLTNLRSLNLYGTKITDAGMHSLSGMTNLSTLYLNNTAITDAGLQYLQGLKKLSDLGLNQTRITDAGLANLQGLQNLHSLSLSGTQITDQGLEKLASIRSLKRVYVGRSRVTAAGIERLKKALPTVQVLK
jgi:hypothetical protein